MNITSWYGAHEQSSDIYSCISDVLGYKYTRHFINGDYATVLQAHGQAEIDGIIAKLTSDYGLDKAHNPSIRTYDSINNGVKIEILCEKCTAQCDKRKDENEVYECDEYECDYTYHKYVYGGVFYPKTAPWWWWKLPGTGDRTSPYCGTVWQGEYKICNEVGKHDLLGEHTYLSKDGYVTETLHGMSEVVLPASTCKKLACPVCYPTAISRMLIRVKAQLMRVPVAFGSFPTAIKQVDIEGRPVLLSADMFGEYIPPVRMRTLEDTTVYGKFKHVVVSPSEEDKALIKTEKGYRELVKKKVKLLKRVGYVGAVSIPHPFKIKKKPKSEIMRINEDTDRRTLIKYAKYNNDHVDVTMDPHFHEMALGTLDTEEIKKVYEETGWVIKELEERKTVYGTLFYELTHAGYHHTFDTITYWGVLARGSKILLDEEEHEDHVEKCACGTELKRYVWAAEGKPLLSKEAAAGEAGVYWVKVDMKNFREVDQLRSDITLGHNTGFEDFEYRYINPVTDEGELVDIAHDFKKKVNLNDIDGISSSDIAVTRGILDNVELVEDVEDLPEEVKVRTSLKDKLRLIVEFVTEHKENVTVNRIFINCEIPGGFNGLNEVNNLVRVLTRDGTLYYPRPGVISIV